MLKGVDSYPIEIMITLAMATGGYALRRGAAYLGPDRGGGDGIADRQPGQAAGDVRVDPAASILVLGAARRVAQSLLFGLVGIEIIALTLSASHLLIAAIAIPLVLLARLVSVALPLAAMARFGDADQRASEL